ncbi:ketopantoate hydroxymethyltransferase domain-containing protein [Ditylenchus destructor]|uniref:3-methyl-2-oxobutanoate hydroxymethyltransferase n=1 Tax=Ditylenchus destructor TaxID=166010 RepID=A0AAD4NEQ1_9BILA|nr:ketopantoate hydroxymethyltransferase domain-containing protein [Ditylenchus destructor]
MVNNGENNSNGTAAPARRLPVTVPRLRQMKEKGERIVMLTCYDASMAAHMASEVDVILVGDSFGNVVQGHPTTLPVTLDEMIYHTKAVYRGLVTAGSGASPVPSPLLVADMPFVCMQSVEQAVEAGARLLSEASAAMVKLEGASPLCLDIISALTSRSIPTFGHLGLTPQSIHSLGGYRVQGKSESAAEKLKADAIAVENAGASLLLLECVPEGLAQLISKSISIPTIGIGAGIHCDGQGLIVYDVLGLTYGFKAKFSKNFLTVAGGSVPLAFRTFAEDVRQGRFPTAEYTYH